MRISDWSSDVCSSDLLALNPNGLVPTVIDGDLVLWESQAILRHYARQNTGAALFPGNPADAARSDMVLDWNITTLWPQIAVASPALERGGVARAADAVHQALDPAGRALARSDESRVGKQGAEMRTARVWPHDQTQTQ